MERRRLYPVDKRGINKRKSKAVRIARAAAVCAAVAGVCKAYTAAAGYVSKGNLDAEGGKIVCYSQDIAYLEGEIGALLGEIDDVPEEDAGEEISVSADGAARRDALVSDGVIDYADGRIRIDAADFAMLADRTDALGDSYAQAACRALNGIGTYFDADGNVNHAAQTAESVVLDSGRIAEGIRQSQSVEHTGASPIAADNLTAGTAAWVNGQCIVGNGADNERAYRRGREDGMEEKSGAVDIQYTCHEHTGNGRTGWDDGAVIAQSSSPGGCFLAGYHEHNYGGQKCSQVAVGHGDPGSCPCDGWQGEGSGGGCKGCGHGEGDHSGGSCNGRKRIYAWDCGEPVNHWKVSCGKKAGQIETATVTLRRENTAAE